MLVVPTYHNDTVIQTHARAYNASQNSQLQSGKEYKVACMMQRNKYKRHG